MSDSEDDVVMLEVKAAAGKKKAATPRKKPATTPKKKPATTPKKKAATTPKKKAAAKKKKDPWDEDTTSSSSEASAYGGKADSDEDIDDGPKQEIEEIYQKKTQLEHILLRPDTYVGSLEPVTQSMWVFDDASKKMESRKITFVPGLYKIFDEIIVNACDNKQRDKSMDTLKVTIDVEKGEISVWNNGKGIPVVMHKEHHVYVPELIFGHLLTGSNFDDKKKKTTGGRNGYGAKLANIFSTQFVVETADSSVKKRYKQVFSGNMSTKEEPVITSWSRKDFTCISFKPDLERFKMEKLDDDIVALFKKRVYDVAGVTDKSLNVYLNDEKIAIKTFPEYVRLYRPVVEVEEDKKDESDDEEDDAESDDEKKKKKKKKDKPATDVIFDKPDGRWHVGVAVSDDGFQQISFVNGICTTKGGQHVNYIADQVVAKLVAVLKKRNKGESVKPNYIKNHMTIYVSALIDNPAFDSQTKECLNTRQNAFGSTYTLSDKFLKQVEKSGMVERILSFAQFKQTAELRRKAGAGGGKRSRLTGIPKLDDANYAGTAKGKDCTLIVTEGDSAKTIAVGGLAVVGRDYYGVFPLRGKLLNVREASHQQILKNEEIKNLAKIIGLKFGDKYESTKGLRYGHLMIMADQDHDGSHIKGLVINLIHHFWPSLLKVEGFLQEFITPIVKCTKGQQKHIFYTMPEYEAWRDSHNSGRGWHMKYYKGLGTNTTAEAKEYFSDLKTHQIDFTYDGDEDGDAIDMAFSKKRVEERKDWLRAHEAGSYVDYDVDEMGYSEFVNKELILFSMADNIRSIPCVVDGFKPSQRKVLFCCFKRNLKVELKVAQLGGYVSEHSAYHHGEQSLYGTIVNMAQDFVGSNNVHLLSPNGQFGTRLMGGKDAASPRYIFTNLEQVTRLIFDARDNDVLKYLDEDGQSIEPEWYIPIIPMALVNGSEGIGTGWSSSIPNYNPFDIIKVLRQKIAGEETAPLIPWYRGFNGHIVPKTSARGTDSQNFVVQGLYEVIDDTTLVVSELPVKMWTQTYKQFLEGLLEAGTITDFKENHTDTKVLFTITMEAKSLREISAAPGGIVKKFKLEGSISTSNMHLFDAHGHIKKYETPEEILNEFYDIRIDYYDRRKHALLKKLADQIKLLSNKTRFVLSVVEGKLIVSNRKKAELLQELIDEGYDQILPQNSKAAKSADDEDSTSDDEQEDSSAATASRGYNYLLSMNIWALTKERVDKLRAELQDREQEYADLDAKTLEQLWLADLDVLETILRETEEAREKAISHTPKAKKKSRGRKPTAKRKKRTKGGDDEDDDGDSDFEMDKPKPKARTPSKPRAKPAATKKEPAAKKEPATKPTAKKTTTITSFFGSKKEKEEDEDKDKDSDSDVEVLSLAERLARRAKETPQKKPKAPAQVSMTVDLVESNDDTKPSKSALEDDEDDVFAMNDENAPKPKKAAAKPKAAPKPKSPAKKTPAKKAPAGRGKALASSLELDDAEEDDDEAPSKPKASLKRRKEATPKQSKPTPKKKRRLADSSDSEEEEESGGEAQDDTRAPPRRGSRVRATISYAAMSSDEEDEEAADDDEDEADASEGDDGSDFE